MKKITLCLLSTLGSVTVTAVTVKQLLQNKVEEQWRISEKHLALFKMMDQWVAVKQQGKNLSDYLDKREYKTIAVYGMSYAGQRLIEELEGSNIQIKYGIDKKANTITIYSNIDIVTMEDELEDVDAIIVTPITFFDEIEKELLKKVNCPIISLEDILYEV